MTACRKCICFENDKNLFLILRTGDSLDSSSQNDVYDTETVDIVPEFV